MLNNYTIQEWNGIGLISNNQGTLCDLCARQLEGMEYVVLNKRPAMQAYCEGHSFGLRCELSEPVAA